MHDGMQLHWSYFRQKYVLSAANDTICSVKANMNALQNAITVHQTEHLLLVMEAAMMKLFSAESEVTVAE